MHNATIDVVIVNYRSPELTLKCTKSIIDFKVTDNNNIYIIDNASPDHSAAILREKLPADVNFIESAVNGGFSAGINVCARRGNGDLILILNPDTYFSDQSILAAKEIFTKTDKVGIVGLDLHYPDGRRQFSGRRFYSIVDILCRRSFLGSLPIFNKRMQRHLMVEEWKAGKPFDADWVMGTGFMIDRKLFERLGGMDERYFLYMEDVDICKRVLQAGYRIICAPNSILYHDHQQASKGRFFSKSNRFHLESLFRYFLKYRIPLM